MARAAYKEQEKQKSLENAAKRAVKGGNTGADEEGGEAEAEEDVEAGVPTRPSRSRSDKGLTVRRRRPRPNDPWMRCCLAKNRLLAREDSHR